MSIISYADLKKFAPAVPSADLVPLVDALNEHLPQIGITERGLRLFHFMAQAAHESGSFALKRECLSYTADRIEEVFPEVKNPAKYAHNPQALAEAVYGPTGFRPHVAHDLGNTRKGDGWRFRGGGIGQLTGRGNYAACGLADDPESITTPENAVASYCFFWHRANCNRYADADDLRSVTLKINGGTNGLDARRAWLSKAKRVFGAPSDESEVITAHPAKVKRVQERLKTLGWNPGKADGVHGTLSRAALLSFQDTAGLDTTGEIDDDTENALEDYDGERPLSEERVTTKVNDLRGESPQVDSAQSGKNATLGGTAILAATQVVGKLTEVKDQVTDTADKVGGLVSFAETYWPVFVILAVGAVVWLYFHKTQAGAALSARAGSLL